MPQQTLRFYEEQDILHPKKNESTGYRYYDAWDLNSLLDAIHYRSLDFSLHEASEIIHEDNQEEIARKYAKQEALVKQKIEQYETMLKIIQKQLRRLEAYELYMHCFEERESPELLFFRHRLRDEFQSVEGNMDFDELNDDMKPWIDAITVSMPTFFIQNGSLEDEDANALLYWWGWSMDYEQAITHGLKPNASNEVLPKQKCLYTVFEAGDEGTFAKAFHDVYRQVMKQGFIVNGNPIGMLILKEHAQGKLHRYFETWIPIE